MHTRPSLGQSPKHQQTTKKVSCTINKRKPLTNKQKAVWARVHYIIHHGSSADADRFLKSKNAADISSDTHGQLRLMCNHNTPVRHASTTTRLPAPQSSTTPTTPRPVPRTTTVDTTTSAPPPPPTIFFGDLQIINDDGLSIQTIENRSNHNQIEYIQYSLFIECSILIQLIFFSLQFLYIQINIS